MGMMEYVEEWVIDMRVRELSEGSIAINKTLLQYYLKQQPSNATGYGYTVLRHKDEILQRERELVRAFLTRFSFFF